MNKEGKRLFMSDLQAMKERGEGDRTLDHANAWQAFSPAPQGGVGNLQDHPNIARLLVTLSASPTHEPPPCRQRLSRIPRPNLKHGWSSGSHPFGVV